MFCNKIRRITDPNDPAAGNVFEVEELFNNRGEISTKGIDLQVDYSGELPAAFSWGNNPATLTANITWTHLLELLFQGNPVSTIESCSGYFSSPCTGVTSSGTSAENRIHANVMYRTEPLSISLNANWISGTDSYRYQENLLSAQPPPVLAVPDIGSQFYLDVNIGYRFNERLSARFGISNLLDRNPPLIPDQVNNTDSQLFDVFGRTYSLSLVFRHDP